MIISKPILIATGNYHRGTGNALTYVVVRLENKKRKRKYDLSSSQPIARRKVGGISPLARKPLTDIAYTNIVIT